MAEIKLTCAQCDTPCAALQNGCLVIQSRHHGECHVTVIPVAELVKLCEQDRDSQEVLVFPVGEYESVVVV